MPSQYVNVGDPSRHPGLLEGAYKDARVLEHNPGEMPPAPRPTVLRIHDGMREVAFDISRCTGEMKYAAHAQVKRDWPGLSEVDRAPKVMFALADMVASLDRAAGGLATPYAAGPDAQSAMRSDASRTRPPVAPPPQSGPSPREVSRTTPGAGAPPRGMASFVADGVGGYAAVGGAVGGTNGFGGHYAAGAAGGGGHVKPVVGPAMTDGASSYRAPSPPNDYSVFAEAVPRVDRGYDDPNDYKAYPPAAPQPVPPSVEAPATTPHVEFRVWENGGDNRTWATPVQIKGCFDGWLHVGSVPGALLPDVAQVLPCWARLGDSESFYLKEAGPTYVADGVNYWTYKAVAGI